ncbi:hypothetical protein A6A04_01680 [Paramagnetospirillum marisnigri]|uniref:Lipoprotein n=1 Tax=Paramagnetospirillum marisnigri TaxID=1285242 RepID=A0A178MN93_9PROT|nr:hypothetical protein [Paramagnetospirillum marisnigri]OAN50146.1 hypothetical protein A6A04_01680 [Paramagnetospirillum marisnigri]
MRSLQLIIASIMLVGCSTLTQGTDQLITVMTPGVDAARCSLTSTSGKTWFVVAPGSVSVEKSKDDISIVCKKEGYRDGAAVATSNLEGMTWGNIVFGGVIGVGVDAASGAMNKYPPTINIQMERI